MGGYVERCWVSDASGMNKAERMGGAYRPYVPDMLEGFELMMEPSCAAAVARATLPPVSLVLATDRERFRARGRRAGCSLTCFRGRRRSA